MSEMEIKTPGEPDWKRLTAEEWRKRLTPEQFKVCREKGTERAFTGKYHDCKDPGLYRCVCCRQELFASRAKYDSGSGWPSYFEPARESSLELRVDRSILFMPRTEVLCGRCGAHLGHLFDDGPEPTGKRYCINSVALSLDPAGLP